MAHSEDTIAKIIQMDKEGYTYRKISQSVLGRSSASSSISDILKRAKPQDKTDNEVLNEDIQRSTYPEVPAPVEISPREFKPKNKEGFRRWQENTEYKTAAQSTEPVVNEDIIVIADTQIDEHSPTDHLVSLSKYIWDHQPGRIVHIGDHWDFPSLSSYSTAMENEGRRLYIDLESGFKAFKIIMGYSEYMNATAGNKVYKPRKHFLMGNHEDRLKRFVSAHPVLEGCFNLPQFILDQGWTVNNTCDPLWINEICFNHYMENPMSGRAVGGGIENKLNKFPHSFIHGHQQQFQYARRQNMKGIPHFGACAGAFYMHDESYRGANNTEIRGFLHLKSFTNRYGYLDYDVEFISLERLLRDWK